MTLVSQGPCRRAVDETNNNTRTIIGYRTDHILSTRVESREYGVPSFALEGGDSPPQLHVILRHPYFLSYVQRGIVAESYREFFAHDMDR